MYLINLHVIIHCVVLKYAENNEWQGNVAIICDDLQLCASINVRFSVQAMASSSVYIHSAVSSVCCGRPSLLQMRVMHLTNWSFYIDIYLESKITFSNSTEIYISPMGTD